MNALATSKMCIGRLPVTVDFTARTRPDLRVMLKHARRGAGEAGPGGHPEVGTVAANRSPRVILRGGYRFEGGSVTPPGVSRLTHQWRSPTTCPEQSHSTPTATPDMKVKYTETARGGLAVNIIEC
ncbi:hypothetical protein ABZ567_09695 [Streptomyces sp. NPDC016459]|uniref:hypothetical protein n=1 Tax=Streptomyces sp. NPDC016459 TaxID=3157190 RepID=UPI0033F9DC03